MKLAAAVSGLVLVSSGHSARVDVRLGADWQSRPLIEVAEFLWDEPSFHGDRQLFWQFMAEVRVPDGASDAVQLASAWECLSNSNMSRTSQQSLDMALSYRVHAPATAMYRRNSGDGSAPDCGANWAESAGERFCSLAALQAATLTAHPDSSIK
jgi:hypothetical protein